MKDKVLDKFLFECKKSTSHFQARNSIQRKRGTSVASHQTKDLSPYANPDNWIPRRIIGLYHETLHASTFLGNFVEFTFRDARRLRKLRDSCQGLSPTQSKALAGLPRSTEILPAFGRESAQRIDSESEILALTQRFNELMGEFSLNHSGVL
jgi:hypothetical protein